METKIKFKASGHIVRKNDNKEKPLQEKSLGVNPNEKENK